MKMYEVVWERAGKRVGIYCVHAANEADALSHAEAFFAEHPEHDFPGGRDGATARVRRYGDFGADEERGRACWEAVDVLGEFVLSIGVGRSSIGSGDRSTRRLSVVAMARIAEQAKRVILQLYPPA